MQKSHNNSLLYATSCNVHQRKEEVTNAPRLSSETLAVLTYLACTNAVHCSFKKQHPQHYQLPHPPLTVAAGSGQHFVDVREISLLRLKTRYIIGLDTQRHRPRELLAQSPCDSMASLLKIWYAVNWIHSIATKTVKVHRKKSEMATLLCEDWGQLSLQFSLQMTLWVCALCGTHSHAISAHAAKLTV